MNPPLHLDIWAFCKAEALPYVFICNVVGNVFCVVVDFSTLLLTCLLYHFNTKYKYNKNIQRVI